MDRGIPQVLWKGLDGRRGWKGKVNSHALIAADPRAGCSRRVSWLEYVSVLDGGAVGTARSTEEHCRRPRPGESGCGNAQSGDVNGRDCEQKSF
jgi:hypothetical protein